MLVALSNTPRDYAWGSITLIAELEGREPTGQPEAEVWFGDHPGSPAPPRKTAQDRRWQSGAWGRGRLPFLAELSTDRRLVVSVASERVTLGSGNAAFSSAGGLLRVGGDAELFVATSVDAGCNVAV